MGEVGQGRRGRQAKGKKSGKVWREQHLPDLALTLWGASELRDVPTQDKRARPSHSFVIG